MSEKARTIGEAVCAAFVGIPDDVHDIDDDKIVTELHDKGIFDLPIVPCGDDSVVLDVDMEELSETARASMTEMVGLPVATRVGEAVVNAILASLKFREVETSVRLTKRCRVEGHLMGAAPWTWEFNKGAEIAKLKPLDKETEVLVPRKSDVAPIVEYRIEGETRFDRRFVPTDKEPTP